MKIPELVLQRDEKKQAIELMEHYLNLKVYEKDWHAVWDAAVDLYKLNAELKILEAILSK